MSENMFCYTFVNRAIIYNKTTTVNKGKTVKQTV